MVIPEGDYVSTIEQLKLPDVATKRLLNFFQRSRVRYLSISSRAELIHPPAGTGHNYPYEVPAFVVEVARRVLAQSRAVQKWR